MDISNNTRIVALIIFFVYSVICIVLGKLGNKKSQGGFGKNFFAAGSGLNGFTNGMLMAAGLCSGGMFLSNPGLAHSWGLMWVLCMSTYAFSGVISNSLANTKMKVICNRLNAVSFGQVLRHRYNNNKFIAWYSPIAVIIFASLFAYQQITSGAKLMETLTGLPYIGGLVVFGVVILLYTLLGGSKGAAKVAVFQGTVMTVATASLAIGLIVYIRGKFGTVTAAFQNLAKTSPEIISPVSTFTFIFLASFLFQVGFAGYVGKDNVAHAIKAKDGKSMHKTSIMTMIFCMIWGTIMPLMGTLGKTVFPDVASDTIVPYASLVVLPGAVAGIVAAGVTAAVMSTVTFHILNITASIVMDVYKNLVKKGNADDKELKKVNMIAMATLVLILVLISIKPPALIGIINNFSVAGDASAFFIPVFFGLWWDRANEYGCIGAMVCGIGYYLLCNLYPAMTFGFNALIPSMVAALLGMVVLSLLTPRPKDEILDVWFGVGKTVKTEDTAL